MSSGVWTSNDDPKYINHMFNPNWIVDSLSGNVMLGDILIECKEFKISVLGLFVNTMRVVLMFCFFANKTISVLFDHYDYDYYKGVYVHGYPF